MIQIKNYGELSRREFCFFNPLGTIQGLLGRNMEQQQQQQQQRDKQDEEQQSDDSLMTLSEAQRRVYLHVLHIVHVADLPITVAWTALSFFHEFFRTHNLAGV